MSGVGWDQRKDGDWLASNGRWYPGNTRPRGWDRTALPPAPDHEASRGSALASVRSRFEDAAGAASQRISDGFESETEAPTVPPPAHTPTPAHSASSAPAPRGDTSFVTTRPRTAGTAEATVVDQREHASRLPQGTPPMPAIGAPPPPGRIRDDAPEMPAPADTNLPAPPPPAPSSIVAGDLGRVLGSARAKIEKRIEDAIEDVEGR